MQRGNLLCSLLLGGSSLAQGQAQYYDRLYGGYANDWAYALAVTPDGSLIVGGSSTSFVSPGNVSDLYMVKCASSGPIIWSKHFNAGNTAEVWDLVASPDNGMVLCGTNNNAQARALRCDSSGMVQWGRASNSMKHFRSCTLSPDSCWYLVGATIGSDQNIGVVKLDWNNGLVWDTCFGTNYSEAVNAIKYTFDGGTVIAGSALVGGPYSDGLLIKLGPLGDVQWSRTYGLSGTHEWLEDAIPCSSGGYLLAGDGVSVFGQPFIIRVDNAGDTLWTRRFNPSETRISSIVEVSGGFLISGEIGGSYYSPYLIKIDSSGNWVWGMEYPSMDIQSALGEVVPLQDGRIAVVCSDPDSGPGYWDMRVVVVDTLGQGLPCNSSPIAWSTLSTVWHLDSLVLNAYPLYTYAWSTPALDCPTLMDSACVGYASINPISLVADTPLISPNPSEGLVSLQGLDHWKGSELRVIDMLGHICKRIRVVSAQERMDLSDLPNGSYCVLLNGPSTSWSSKILIQH